MGLRPFFKFFKPSTLRVAFSGLNKLGKAFFITKGNKIMSDINDFEDSDNIRVEMAYSLIHDDIVDLLIRNEFISDCKAMAEYLFDTQTIATQKMKGEILEFLEVHSEVVLDVTARFLFAVKDGALSNAVIPLLNNVEVATVFDKDRFVPFANLILTVLCCRAFDVDGVQTPYIEALQGENEQWWLRSCITNMPDLKDGYRLPSQKPLEERHICDRVTGSVMAKVENLNTDKCLEILGYLSNVKLCYSRNWLAMPEMLLKEDASDEEAESFSQYTELLAEPISKIVRNMAYFYNDLIVDYRLRVYSRLDSVNFTANKQIRSMLMAYDKEKVEVTDIKVDPSIEVKLPEL